MKEDLRVTKTKKLLYETLISLMEEKSFEEIKVKKHLLTEVLFIVIIVINTNYLWN